MAAIKPTRLHDASTFKPRIVDGTLTMNFPVSGETDFEQQAWNTVRGLNRTMEDVRGEVKKAVYPRTDRPLYGYEMSGKSVGDSGGGFNPVGDAILMDADGGNVHAFRDALQSSVDEAKVAFGSDQLTVMLWHVTKYHSLAVSGDYPAHFDQEAFPFICPSRVTPAYIASLESWFQDLCDDGDVPGLYIGTVPQIEADTSSLIREGMWVRHPDDDAGASLAVFKAGLKWCIDRGAVEIGLDIFNWFRAWRGYPGYTGGAGWEAHAPDENWNGEDEMGMDTFGEGVPKDEDFDLFIESLLLTDPEINNARYILEPFAPLGRMRFPTLERVASAAVSDDEVYTSATLPSLGPTRLLNPGTEVLAYLHHTLNGWGAEGELWDEGLDELKAKGYRPASHYFAMNQAGKVSAL